METFKTPEALQRQIKKDILADTVQGLVGEGDSFEAILRTELSVGILKEIQKLVPNGGYSYKGSSRTAKYSTKWFASALVGGRGQLGHLFSSLAGVGINNSVPPENRQFEVDDVGNVIDKRTGELITSRLNRMKSYAKTVGKVNTSASKNDIKTSEIELNRISRKLAQQMNFLLTANPYSYQTKADVTRWNYEDITIYEDIQPDRITGFIKSNVIKTIKSNSTTFKYRFQVQDVDLLKYLYQYKVDFPTWQDAYVSRHMGIIVHDIVGDIDDYKFKIHN